MYAPRHLVFAGQGRLTEELREVIAKRTGTPQPDLPLRVPRLLGAFDNAAEAERVAAGLQRLKIGSLVAGPEQPAVEAGWMLATGLELFAGRWQVSTSTGETLPLALDQLTAVTIVDWRPEDQPVDRAVLLKTGSASRPVLLRASAIDSVSPLATPGQGLLRLGQLLDDCAIAMPSATRVRRRRLTPEEFELATLNDDALPLAVAVIDALDIQPHVLARPISGTAPPPAFVPSESPLSAFTAWTLYATALALGPVCLGLLMLAVMVFSPTAMVTALLAGAVGTRRLLWARWLSLACWGLRTPVPHWPLGEDDLGRPPVARELLLDLSLVVATIFGALGLGSAAQIQAILIAPMAAVLLLGGLAVAARQSEER
jgi:hypothetical protein